MGREGADGVEQGASTAAREAEGDDEDEAMEGDENVSLQRAEEGEGRAVSKAAASCSTSTGLGPRGMTVRHCPPGSVSQNLIVRGPF